MTSSTTSRQFFEAKYEADPDPWNFASSRYELDRYGSTIDCLAGRRFKRAFEPGCSVGVLTGSLASICGEVIAMDISSAAVERATHRCRQFTNVTVYCGTLPNDLPGGLFDLIVLSEIGYYFDRAALQNLAYVLVERLEANGTAIGVHWLGQSEDHLLGGECVHEILSATTGLSLEHTERHADFRLDRWRRT